MPGVPHEAVAIATGAIPGCDLYINMPANASDSYCYNAAIKVLNNFPAGRRVYVELMTSRGISVPRSIIRRIGTMNFLATAMLMDGTLCVLGRSEAYGELCSAGSRSCDEIYMGVGVWTVYAANQPMIPSLKSTTSSSMHTSSPLISALQQAPRQHRSVRRVGTQPISHRWLIYSFMTYGIIR